MEHNLSFFLTSPSVGAAISPLDSSVVRSPFLGPVVLALAPTAFALLICAVLAKVVLAFGRSDDVAKLPLVNGKKWWQFTASKQKQNYCKQAKEIIDRSFKEVSSSDITCIKLLISDPTRSEMLSVYRQTMELSCFCQQTMPTALVITKLWISVVRSRR